MVRIQDEISASVGGFSVDLSGQYRICLDGQNIQDTLPGFVSVLNWMEGLKLLRWLRKFCNRFGP
jgi:hypothetical protein